MSTPEISPYQQMANTLANYQRVLAENVIRTEDPDYIQRMWKESEDVVDGLEPFSPDGRMDPAIHKEILDDLTKLVGGHPPEVGRDMTIPRQTLVEQSFRSSMQSEIDETLKAISNTLEFRRGYADKVPVSITSPEWSKAFYEYVIRIQSSEPGDELSIRRAGYQVKQSSGELLGDLGELDVRFARNGFVVIRGGKQEMEE